MDLNQIALFVRVVDQGSFTGAARTLKLPKSKVSRHIANLEKQLGVSLLYRSTRQLGLTDAGRRLYEETRQAVYDLHSVGESLETSASEVRGRLKISAADDLGLFFVSPLLVELGQKYPDLAVDVILTNVQVDLVKDSIDVAIRIGKLADASYKRKPLGDIRLIVVASPRYLKRAKKIRSLDDLKSHPALSFAPNGVPEWRLGSEIQAPVRVPIQNFRTSNNPHVAIEAAIAGLGLALVPEFLCREPLQKGRLQRVLPSFSTAPVPVQLVWPSHREPKASVRAFIALTDQAAKLTFR